jgi:hypothetical protein
VGLPRSRRHGSAVLEEMGRTSGFILQADGEPTVYWVGDSIWCEEVAGSIRRFAPRVIITHSSGAVWGAGELIVMDAAQTLEVCRAAPRSTVIAVHMEALDHGTVSRRELRARAEEAGISPDRLAIPADGEEIRSERGGFGGPPTGCCPRGPGAARRPRSRRRKRQ